MTRVLSIGTDRKVFEEGSAARARQETYAARLGALDLIVFTRGEAAGAFSHAALSATPTASRSKLLYGLDAWHIARRLPRPDVVTVQDPFETGLIGLCIARTLGVPLHAQVHTDFTSPAFSRHSLANRLRVRIAWFVLRRAARVRVILERTRDALREGGIAAPIAVLPIFVDVARLSALSRERHPRFKISALYVGRLEPEKHPCLAIDAVAAARAAGHDIGLTIVGEGSERAVLEERARAAGLGARVAFAGFQRDVASFLAKADVVLVPSHYEGYGLVIVEALAAGVPVIATDVGVAREAGAIVTDERHFAQTLAAWISDGPRAASLASYPYASFDEYVEKWCADFVAAMARAQPYEGC